VPHCELKRGVLGSNPSGITDVRMVVRYGKAGTKGQENVKVFETEVQTKTEIDKLISQKVNKGYKAN